MELREVKTNDIIHSSCCKIKDQRKLKKEKEKIDK